MFKDWKIFLIMEIERIDGGITAVEGVYCCGIREGKKGLGIVKCKGEAAGVFTCNKIKAAPVVVTQEHLKDGIEGIIVNSGNANAFTALQGIKNARRMAEILASKLGVDESKIAVASTGVIGVQLDMEWIEKAFEVVFPRLGSTRESSLSFAKAIMTTDRYPKEYAVKAGSAVIAGVAKGAGMIAPNLATMLAFIFTNAKFEREELREMLKEAVNRSFNLAVVDGDTSTNDMVLLVATGREEVERDIFQMGLNDVCFNLARMIVRDGEGATKLVEVHVKGAKSSEDALKGAKSIVSSLLVKTAIFGNDPNFGRIVAALGYSDAEVDENLTLILEANQNSIKLVENGRVMNAREEARKIMEKSNEIRLIIDLHKGRAKAYAMGCDLSYNYVRMNAGR
jgi:glutamate N-acetyltransferase/amino-acid N-acetyltransferase